VLPDPGSSREVGNPNVVGDIRFLEWWQWIQIKTRTKYTPIRHSKDRQDRHLSESPKYRRLATPNAGEDVEQQKFSFITSGNAKWCSHLGR